MSVLGACLQVENGKSAWESREVLSPLGDCGIYNSLIVGWAGLNATSDPMEVGTKVGVWLPYHMAFEVKDTGTLVCASWHLVRWPHPCLLLLLAEFVNFASNAGALKFCAHCGRGGSPSPEHGGFETKVSGLTFNNVEHRAWFRHR